MNLKKVVTSLVVVLIIGALCIGCGEVKTPQLQNKAKTNVVVNIAGLQGPSSISMIKMFEDKPLLGDNVETNYIVAKTPDILVSKLISKEVDIAAIPTNLAAKIYNKGIDYKIIAMNTWGVMYFIGTDNTIKKWEDLKGKKIYAVGKGSNPDVVLRYLLNKNGLNPEKDVIIDYSIAQVELAQAVAGGKVSLALLPEPFVTMAQIKNKDVKVIFDVQREWKKINGEKSEFTQTCIVASGDLIKNHNDIIEKFKNELKNSMDWVNENKVLAGILVEKHGIGMKAKIAKTAIPRCNIKYENAQDAKQALNTFFKIILDYSPKDIGGKLPDENFYY